MKRYNTSVAKTVLALSLLFPTLSVPVQAAGAVSTATSINVVIDGKIQSYEQPPVMLNNRVMVPLRSIFEALGATVEWNAEHQAINAVKDGIWINAFIGEPTLTVDNFTFEYEADQAPIIYNNRTMVSVRMISELFGAEVEWDAKTQTVKINTDYVKLFDAVADQDLGQLKKLLTSGLNPDGQAFGKTALEYAFAQGKLESAKFLLTSGADPKGVLFYQLIMDGEIERSKFYLAHRLPNKEVPHDVEGALFSAASFNYTDLVRELVALGTDVDAPQFAAHLKKNTDSPMTEFHTPLGYAISNYNLDMVELLLQAGADPNNIVLVNGNRSPLIRAAERNQASLINLLLRYQATPDAQTEQGWTPLMIAADFGSTAAVKALLAGKANVNLTNKGGANALMIAEAHGHTEIVKLLEAAGAVRNQNTPDQQALFFQSDLLAKQETAKWTPLMKAAFLGDTGQVKTLLAQGANPGRFNEEGAPFKLALESGNQETIRAFIAKQAVIGPDAINAVMQIAILKRNLELAEFAIHAGANASDRILGLGNYLSFVAGQNNLELVKLLLEHGANVSPENGFTPLVEAARGGGQEQVVKTLVAAYKDEARKAFDLGEALLFAVTQQNVSMVKLLLELGADPNYEDEETFSTPLQVAEMQGFPELITLLKQAAATK